MMKMMMTTTMVMMSHPGPLHRVPGRGRLGAAAAAEDGGVVVVVVVMMMMMMTTTTTIHPWHRGLGVGGWVLLLLLKMVEL